MFSWFSETADFFSQVAHNFNWAFHYCIDFLSTASDSVEVANTFSNSLPAEIAWIFPATFLVMGFHFIRGHW